MVSINFISDVLVLQCSTNVGGVSGRGLGRPSTNHRSVGVVEGVVSVGCRPIKFYIVESTFYHYLRQNERETADEVAWVNYSNFVMPSWLVTSTRRCGRALIYVALT